MMRKFPWLVFVLVFGWKIALFVFSAQPVPANDAFFYDGAVIHKLLQGGYYNPCVALAFPVSGTEVFSAYPPLYQVPLLGWMSVFGVSALSAIALHLTLFGLYLLVVLAIFRRLQTPAWCVNLAGVFLLVFTFHDRPDSLAHLLGVIAVYACVRSRRILYQFSIANDAGGSSHQHIKTDRREVAFLPLPKGEGRSEGEGDMGTCHDGHLEKALLHRQTKNDMGHPPESNACVWVCAMVLCIILALCASLQIGGIYFLVVSIATIASCHLGKEPIPFLPMSLMVLVPVALVLLVKLTLPRPWAGFMENVHQTPFITGLRKPHWQEVVKIIRTVPGILLIMILLPWTWFKLRPNFSSNAAWRYGILLLAALLPALGILVASLSILAPNTVAISNYLQPVIVASYLGLIASLRMEPRWLRWQVLCLLPAMLLGSVRAVGMTTWGLACAADVSYSSAVQKVEEQLTHHPAGYKVVMSSAFLYGAAKHDELTLIHSDWLTRANGDSRLSDSQALLTVKPEKMILTQYDYYRRFKGVLETVKGSPGLKDIQILDTARTPPPDSYKSLQQVVQHISWAPVIITLSWQDGQ